MFVWLACSSSVDAALATSPASRPDPPPRRTKKNKYAQFSKVEEVKRSLRFSNVETAAEDGAALVADAPTQARKRERNKWLYPDETSIDQRDPTTFGFVEIGRVLGAHGVHGEMKVSTQSDFALERLCTPGVRWLRRPRRRAPREVLLTQGRVGPGNGVFIVRLDGVAGRDEAQGYKGSYLFSRREIVPVLESDELLLWQLEGLLVARVAHDGEGEGGGGGELRAGEVIGRVRGVVPREELTGNPNLGNDLLEIELLRPREEGEEEEQQQVKSAALGSAPARLLRLLTARLVVLGSSALPGRNRPTAFPAAASAARASRLQSRPFHCVRPNPNRPGGRPGHGTHTVRGADRAGGAARAGK